MSGAHIVQNGTGIRRKTNTRQHRFELENSEDGFNRCAILKAAECAF
jgi:hypothetical protein